MSKSLLTGLIAIAALIGPATMDAQAKYWNGYGGYGGYGNYGGYGYGGPGTFIDRLVGNGYGGGFGGNRYFAYNQYPGNSYFGHHHCKHKGWNRGWGQRNRRYW